MGAENSQQGSQPPPAGFMVKLETALLCLLLGTMITLACLQIILRTFFDGGLLWAEPLLRYLVLWSGFLGAVLATYKGSHIAIDLVDYLVAESFKPLVKLLCALFSAATSAVLTWASILFIRSEFEFGGEALFNIPSWCWNSIFPLAFLLITLRYAVLSVELTVHVFSSKDIPPNGGVR